MRFCTLFIALGLFLQACPAAWGQSDPLGHLRDYVRGVIRDYPQAVEPADFRIDPQYLYYDFGRFKPQGWQPSLYDAPLALEFKVELIRSDPRWRGTSLRGCLQKHCGPGFSWF